MAEYPTQVYNAEQPSNNLGLAGFITSLLGVITCGLLSPIGFLLSLFGVFFKPRGFALAGLLIGAIGSVWILIAALFFGAILFGSLAVALGMPEIGTYARVGMATSMVEEYRSRHGELPDASAWQQLEQKAPFAFTDAWDNALRYTILGEGDSFEVRSAGKDGEFDTADDLKANWANSVIQWDVDIDRAESEQHSDREHEHAEGKGSADGEHDESSEHGGGRHE